MSTYSSGEPVKVLYLCLISFDAVGLSTLLARYRIVLIATLSRSLLSPESYWQLATLCKIILSISQFGRKAKPYANMEKDTPQFDNLDVTDCIWRNYVQDLVTSLEYIPIE
ncbi:hypothetical protein HYPSUDRAFT_49069 [Hypholoma sublateritium FD-334 SS-4]|uniref:Uncharacterized protein n=1 Tax=Hypholoma sublateritium (strain FD-334 SS-4) TaxID=945553 RepID=A0A0D2N5R5_HYPSF|nr:hypothetical protein HYPSUDRAFT_49069 [Hypholoma sublateritium FD-334 SS-4]